jgi:hypothetical protein
MKCARVGVEKSVKKNHPEWEKEKKMGKVTEKCYPDLSPRRLKPVARQVAENERQ